MRAPYRRRLAQLLGGLAVGALVAPQSAQAHGIVGKADLPIPVWLFSWTAAIVLVVSFVALSTMWTRPQLQEPRLRRLLRLPRVLEWLAGLFGVAVFALVIYSGFDGAQVTQANFSVTFIYVVFWVGTPVASVLFGDLFRALSPWRSCARACAALLRLARGGRPASPLLRYPKWLGLWPASAGIVGFAWLELIYVEKDRPSILAALSLAYFLAMLAGMALFGVEEWSSQADGFGVYFNLLSKLSALVRGEDGVVYLRRPLSGVTNLEIRSGTVAFICMQIGTTTFDGFSNGGIWRNNEPSLQSLFEGVGFNPTPAQELAYSVGLVFCMLLISAVYRVGIFGVQKVSERYDRPTLTRAFAHSLVPIAFAYVLAHYFSLLLWQSQAMVYLASDPLGNGANIFGTSGYQIDYHVISYAAIWYVQVAALVSGHVGGLALAHDRALVLYKDPEEAVRSQYWMLAVMVAFTSFGLWLLSAVGDMSAASLGYGFGAMARRPLPVLLSVLCVTTAVFASATGSAQATPATTIESQNPINDQGSSYEYRSNITAVTPSVPGLSIEVLEFADRLLLRNHTGRTVTIYGYEGEPYARVLANGTAEQNARAPATYLNTNFYADVTVPPSASAGAPPKWEVVDRTGEFEWHDHRIHWMSPVPPATVKDKSRRTLIFDWRVPIMVGTTKGAIDGQLFWTPESSKAPLAVIILGIAIAVAGAAFVALVRRRRARAAHAGRAAGTARGAGGPADEAW